MLPFQSCKIFTDARTAADDQQELDPELMTRIQQPERRMGACK